MSDPAILIITARRAEQGLHVLARRTEGNARVEFGLWGTAVKRMIVAENLNRVHLAVLHAHCEALCPEVVHLSFRETPDAHEVVAVRGRAGSEHPSYTCVALAEKRGEKLEGRVGRRRLEAKEAAKDRL